MKELRVIAKYTSNSFQTVFTNTGMFIFFLITKLIRIGLFLSFLYFLLQGTSGIGDYSKAQIIFFYLSFNLIDTLGQLMFREVYRFRPLIISGGLDGVLAKPIHPLIRVLLGGPDVIDLAMLVIVGCITVWFGIVNLHPSLSQWILYALLTLNSVVIAAAFHIFVLGIGTITTSVDHIVMIYRDLTALMRIPVDLYIEPIRSLLTFVLPIGIMLSVPPKALMGLISWPLFILSVVISSLLLFAALRFWNYSLTKYQSASS